MQTAILILEIIIAFGIFALGLFTKNFFPSYMDKKGENLATKEDIEEITKKTEAVQQEFREGFELFSSDVRFKYDFYYRQYSELYCKLYSIVIQSEYVRNFLKLDRGQEISFDEAPFVEMSPSKKVSQQIDFKAGEQPCVTSSEEIYETPLSKFNKSQMCSLIVENDSLASQELLKIAVSYRFAEFYYSGNKDVHYSDAAKTADEEEFRLIREMVCCIVKEYNMLRKELKMPYDEDEIADGIPRF